MSSSALLTFGTPLPSGIKCLFKKRTILHNISHPLEALMSIRVPGQIGQRVFETEGGGGGGGIEVEGPKPGGRPGRRHTSASQHFSMQMGQSPSSTTSSWNVMDPVGAPNGSRVVVCGFAGTVTPEGPCGREPSSRGKWTPPPYRSVVGLEALERTWGSSWGDGTQKRWPTDNACTYCTHTTSGPWR